MDRTLRPKQYRAPRCRSDHNQATPAGPRPGRWHGHNVRRSPGAPASWPRSAMTDARALRAYAGSASVTAPPAKAARSNQRLAAAGYIWALAALTASTQARAHYDQCLSTGDRHAASLRHLFNRFLSQLHHCLITREHYHPTGPGDRGPRHHLGGRRPPRLSPHPDDLLNQRRRTTTRTRTGIRSSTIGCP